MNKWLGISGGYCVGSAVANDCWPVAVFGLISVLLSLFDFEETKDAAK